MSGHQFAAVILVSCTFKEGAKKSTRSATSQVSVEDLNQLFPKIGSEVSRKIDDLKRGIHFYEPRPETVITVWVVSAESVAYRNQGLSEPFQVKYLSGDRRKNLYEVMSEELRQQILDYLHTS